MEPRCGLAIRGERGGQAMGACRATYVLGEDEIRAAHVVPPIWHLGWPRVVFDFDARPYANDHLQRRIEAVEKAPERVEPAHAVILGGVRESDRVRVGDDQLGICSPAGSGLAPREADHRQRNRYVAVIKITMSASQLSTARPRHRPHAAAAPTAAMPSAATPRTGGVAQWADQTENAASNPTTRYASLVGVRP